MYAGADVTTVALSQGEGRPHFVGQRLICGCATSRGVTAGLGWDWGPQSLVAGSSASAAGCPGTGTVPSAVSGRVAVTSDGWAATELTAVRAGCR